MITNGAADHLVAPDDAPALWEQAIRALANDLGDQSDLVLTGGTTVALA
jgi:hypothetical protein